MSANLVFGTGSAGAIYDAELGPLVFTPYAQDLIKRLPALAGPRVLEVAAGTGRLTRELAEALPTGARITATDISEGTDVALAGASVT